jgi:hypothetical protein
MSTSTKVRTQSIIRDDGLSTININNKSMIGIRNDDMSPYVQLKNRKTVKVGIY